MKVNIYFTRELFGEFTMHHMDRSVFRAALCKRVSTQNRYSLNPTSKKNI